MNFMHYFQNLQEDFGYDPNLEYKAPIITGDSYQDTNYTKDQFQHDYIEGHKYYEEEATSPATAQGTAQATAQGTSQAASPATAPATSQAASPATAQAKNKNESTVQTTTQAIDATEEAEPESCNSDIFNLDCHKNLKILLWVLMGFSALFTIILIIWIIFTLIRLRTQTI